MRHVCTVSRSVVPRCRVVGCASGYFPEHVLSLFSSLLVSIPGYVGKWKRHWFVLNDAVLYYFITPQHQDEAPRCIIPLEGINISPIGATDLSIGLRVRPVSLLHCSTLFMHWRLQHCLSRSLPARSMMPFITLTVVLGLIR